MKTIIRLFFGFVSSLLLSAGLSRAAATLDPLPRFELSKDATQVASTPCIMPCLYVPRPVSAQPGSLA